MKSQPKLLPAPLSKLTLPVFPLLSHSIFPHTFFLIKPKSGQRAMIENFLKNKPPQCVVVVQNIIEGKINESSFYKIGVVSRVEVHGDGFNFFAEYRAKLENIAHYPQQGIWKADVLRLPDIPALAGLTTDHCDLPMILAAVESSYRLLTELRVFVKDYDGLSRKLDEQIKKLKKVRREKETAYSLPWHILIDFDHLSEEIKGKMLEADSVMERLQILIDILKSEIKIFRSAQVLAEDEPEDLGGKGK